MRSSEYLSFEIPSELISILQCWYFTNPNFLSELSREIERSGRTLLNLVRRISVIYISRYLTNKRPEDV